MTTVGYGDIVPITGGGRIVAVTLMLSGGVLFLAFIALLASAFVEVEFMELEGRLRRLQRELEDRMKSAPQRGDD